MSEKLYGLLAEFDTPTELVDAANTVREAGYTKTDAFSPFPIHDIDEALGIKRSVLPLLVFFGAITGLLLGISLQVFVHYIDYPTNVGGRPYLSWPSFVPPSYELTILLAGFTAVFGMLFLNGLPRPYHPVFNIDRFGLASREKFFLLVEAADPKYDYDKTKALLATTNPQEVFDVPE
jgi:hypothetical protein